VSNLIKKYAPDATVRGNDNPPRSGAFEVKKDGDLVYSKFDTGEFPNEKEVKSWF